MVEDSDHDIWNRRGSGMWGALGALAKGILLAKNETKRTPYETVYAEPLETYRDTLRQIAIINIKKLSGGNREDSDASKKTKHFSCHACKFKDKLQKQIDIINPTIIICCGTDVKDCFDITDNKIYGIPAIVGLHPATNPNCRRKAFYYDTIENIQKLFL